MQVFLDATPLGRVTNPNASPENVECSEWLEALLARGVTVRVPEIADYEVRRELMRADKTPGLMRLNKLAGAIGYIPLTTVMMREAAHLWSDVRKRGLPTADDKALDGDAILAAQAIIISAGTEEIVIATDNVGHLARFATVTVTAKEWRDIT